MAQTVAELEAELAWVRQAIKDCIQLQSYSKPGFSVNRAQLKELCAERNRLELKIARMSNGGAIVLSDFSMGEGSVD